MAAPARRAGPSVLPARERPLAGSVPRAACSFLAPVCVHAGASVAEGSILRALASAERSLRAMTALGLPLPLPDDDRGGDARYDLYLVEGALPPFTVPDGIATGGAWDRAAAFTVLPPPDPAAGCEFDAAVTRALAHASVLRLDAGAEPSAMGMVGTELAATIVDCGLVDAAAVDDFQRAPERSLTALASPDEPTGAFLFARFLDEHYGRGVPTGVLWGLLAVAGQRTEASALHFANEPDLFDALRSNARAHEKPFEDLLLDFAVDRAFVGSRSDGGHLVDVERFGDFGRVRFEWAVAYDTLPRRLAPLRPIEATGATYLWLDLQGAPEDAEITFAADWELGVFFHWTLVKIDHAGAEVGRATIAGINGATHADRTIRDVRGLAGLMVVGVNVGSIDRSHPFDPDEGPELPRAYTVTFYK
ncbi:hypothetical protein [Polyangium sorediatum]|uniref:Uncharacterized protein n=1 Tax=Polyangium sorediatum TaxID=889274 RepID=A0ABT6NNU3_9BACT|nr:hypothetical protein [Polyangium sorediatum]MDI1429979.1 hypothetical protein [Polyangium sorediatum]